MINTDKKVIGFFPHPCTCDVCNIGLDKVLYDGVTTMGPWALMCYPCHRDLGRGLGLGKGQRYEWTECSAADGCTVSGKWVKTAG